MDQATIDNTADVLLHNILSLYEPEQIQRTVAPFAPDAVDILPIEEWLSDPYYVGNISYELYEYWRDVIIEFSTGEYNELILTGAVGTGKSYAALVLFLRTIYELSCRRPVPQSLGLASSSTILFVYLTISLKQADLTGYGKLTRMVDSIQYFQDCFKRNPKRSSIIEFPGDEIVVVPGSDISHWRGGDLFGLIFDEGNFRQGSDAHKFNKAIDIYIESVNRRASRFAAGESDPSLSIIVSSVDTTTSFTESRIKATKDDSKTLIVHCTTWQTRPKKYGSKRFWVFPGNELIDPFTDQDVQAFITYCAHYDLEAETISDLPPRRLREFIEVPEEFRKGFTVDVYRALADVCGVSIGSPYKFFSAKPAYDECFQTTDTLWHPFTQQTIMLSHKGNAELADWLRSDWPGLDKDYTYYVHIDQSLTGDRTGIAIAHVEAGKQGRIIVIDLMLAITAPPKPEEIGIKKIREFVLYLDTQGADIELVTYDQFGSAESIQEFENAGMTAERLSVDRDSSQYDLLKELVLDGGIKGYKFELFETELFGLEKNGKKVDHIAGGSKDVGDAVAGAVWGAFHNNNEMRIRYV